MRLQALDMEWAGPLADIIGLPEVAVVGLVLTFSHRAGPLALKMLEQMLMPLMGRPKLVHARLVQRYLTWSKPRWQIALSSGPSASPPARGRTPAGLTGTRPCQGGVRPARRKRPALAWQGRGSVDLSGFSRGVGPAT